MMAILRRARLPQTRKLLPLLNSHCHTPPYQSPSLDALPIEIFLIIVQELDAPTLTCLALANHKLYNAILQHFAIARLHQLCPQYLRSPYLKMLIPKAFNLLIPNHDKVSGVETDWKIQNFVAIPSSTTHVCGIYNDPGLQYMVRCLALVRRYAWIGSLGAYGGIMPDIWQFIKLAKTDESLETQNTWMTNMQHLATTPHVESVEFMVLKDLLGEWMSKMHGR